MSPAATTAAAGSARLPNTAWREAHDGDVGGKEQGGQRTVDEQARQDQAVAADEGDGEGDRQQERGGHVEREDDGAEGLRAGHRDGDRDDRERGQQPAQLGADGSVAAVEPPAHRGKGGNRGDGEDDHAGSADHVQGGPAPAQPSGLTTMWPSKPASARARTRWPARSRPRRRRHRRRPSASGDRARRRPGTTAGQAGNRWARQSTASWRPRRRRR